LIDFLLDLPAFKKWTRKHAKKLLQAVKYERVLKGWERQNNGIIEKGISTGPDGKHIFIVLEGEFEYGTMDKESNKIHRCGGTSRKDFDIRKLLFSR
jgi:hypothetical protein